MFHPRLATLLLLFVAAVGMVGTGVAAVESRALGHHPPLLDCGPAPVLSNNDDATFRANLASALTALPSAVAAAEEAFGTVQAGSAFARGACFGANVSSSPAKASACEACLSAAAKDVTCACGASSGRAGVWRAGCFLSYAADSNASSAREDAFRGWFYAEPSTNATMLAAGVACLPDRAVDCDRCLRDSARAAAALGWWQRIHGEEVLVVGYSCYGRARISSLPEGPNYTAAPGFALMLWMELVLEAAAAILGFLLFHIIQTVRALP